MNTSLHQRSGEQALREPTHTTGEPANLPPVQFVDCSFCFATIPTDATYHTMIVGMNEDGAASATDAARTVEEVSEMTICSECHPRIDAVMDGFLERLWDMRRPSIDAPPETEPEPRALVNVTGASDRFELECWRTLFGTPESNAQRITALEKAASPEQLALADTQRVTLPEVFQTPFGPVSSEHVDMAAQIMHLARRSYPQSPEGFLLGLVVGRLLAAGLSEEDIHGIVSSSAQQALGKATQPEEAS